MSRSFIALHAKLSSTVYCYRSCLFVCLLIACIDLHQTGSVGEAPSCAPWGGGLWWGENFMASAYYSIHCTYSQIIYFDYTKTQ